MKALALIPRQAHSAALIEMPALHWDQKQLLVELRALGVCGTDKEIMHGDYGWAPQGKEKLIIGHESLGEVVAAPVDSGFNVGDLVVGVVRRPDPVPCSSCVVGEWDMCRNGRYTERGIKELDGFGVERYHLEPKFAVAVDQSLGELGVLTEPCSVVAKAWQQIEKIGRRSRFTPKRVLITGAGTIGLLALMMGRQQGLEVHVLDRVTSGRKPTLVKEMGAVYHETTSTLQPLQNTFDIVIECTGNANLVLEVITIAGPNSIVCLTGVSSGGREIAVDLGRISRNLVLENGVIFGSVNANLLHYEIAVQALREADQRWLSKLITRRLPLSLWKEAFSPASASSSTNSPDAQDVKTILMPDKRLTC